MFSIVVYLKMNRTRTYYAYILIAGIFLLGVHSQDDKDDGNLPADLQDPTKEDPERKVQSPIVIEDVKLDPETIRQQLENLEGPKDANEMAKEVLQNTWDNNVNGTGQTSVEKLLPVINKIGGEERLHLLRLLELLDKNMDLNISKQELVSLYSGPMASPVQALELMFRLQDYNGNGYISTYETLNVNICYYSSSSAVQNMQRN